MSEPSGPAAGATQARIERAIARRWPVLSAAAAVLAVVGLGALVSARASTNLVDTEFLGELVEHRSPLWSAPSLVFNQIGAGVIGVFIVPLAVSVALLVRRHPWGALYWIASVAVSAGAVQGLKHLFGRARPPEILVTSDFGSFPSGHVANAATMAVVLSIIVGRWWAWAVGILYTIAMLLSRTYLGAHWLTDTIGGMLLGASVAIVLWAPLAYRLLRERWRGRWLWTTAGMQPSPVRRER